MKRTIPRVGLPLLAAAWFLLPTSSAEPAAPSREGAGKLPTPAEMAVSKTDVWGEAALAQPGGPSYEFFKDLLPPLRYVNTDFRHYPIVLGPPAGPVKTKARWVSNGSGVNARANKKPMWYEIGFPIRFHVGDPAELFGDDVPRLDGPRYVEGHLPIVQVAYSQRGTTYSQEAFAPVGDRWVDQGTVFLRFQARGEPGILVAQLDFDAPVKAEGGSIRDVEGRALFVHDDAWQWDGTQRRLQARLAPGVAAHLAVLTQPMAGSVPDFNSSTYDSERRACADRWKELLGRGTSLKVPEPIVQDAWRSLIVGNFVIAAGDRMHYSANNAYDHLYESECGDATRSLLLYGFLDEARRMVKPLLDFNRQATRYHVAGHKLKLLSQYYWVTRDAESLRTWEPTWGPIIDFLVQSRRPDNGLLPPDRYAGDLKQEVFALSSNSTCWRGLRDMAAVLDDLGEHDRAKALSSVARSYRAAILKAVDASVRRDSKPPFIPNALYGDEPAYDVLTATRLSSYYDLMAPYVLGSGVFGPGDERETWMIDYFRAHGALAMGMIRSMPHQGQFNNMPGVNPLYGQRYMLTLLRRDDRGHALVGFYGQLAQGMTRETYIGGEASRLLHGDRWGRGFYLPPNSASNAGFLSALRYLLLQDWDLNDDGRPETLRLLFGAPARWLDDSKVLEMTGAPSAFGAITYRVESHRDTGEVRLNISPPPRRPDSFLVRLPLPDGWTTTAATTGATDLPLRPDGTIDLSRQTGPLSIRVKVEKPKE